MHSLLKKEGKKIPLKNTRRITAFSVCKIKASIQKMKKYLKTLTISNY